MWNGEHLHPISRHSAEVPCGYPQLVGQYGGFVAVDADTVDIDASDAEDEASSFSSEEPSPTILKYTPYSEEMYPVTEDGLHGAPEPEDVSDAVQAMCVSFSVYARTSATYEYVVNP